MSSSSKSEMENKFICIHCGHPVAELYKNYSPSVLKIMNCVCYAIAARLSYYSDVNTFLLLSLSLSCSFTEELW